MIVFPFDILGNKVHRTRTVKGNSRNNILQILGTQLLHEIFHARTFQLKDTVRPARADGSENIRIIVINIININMHSTGLFYVFYRILYYGERAKPQKIHFEQTQFLQSSHGKLGGNRSVASP